MQFVYTIAWLIAIIFATLPTYWLLVHPRIRFWRARNARLIVVGSLWPLLWLMMGAITWRWRYVTLYHTAWTWIPAVALLATGLWIYPQARKDFTLDQVLGRAELQPERHEQRLIVHGIRARVRHPLYLGHLCELLGWTLGTGLLVLYGLTLLAIITGAVMIKAEERELEARFGDQYRDYKQRVPAIFPRL